jgi:hypothetical protein
MTVNGNVSVGVSTILNGGGFSHQVGGNWVNSGTFNGNTSTITFTGSGSSVSGSGVQNFNNLTIAAPQVSFSNDSFTLAGNLATTGSGSLIQASGGTFVMTGSGKSISGSEISIDNLTVSGSVSATASLNLTGNLLVNGTFSSSGGIVTMSGVSKTISGSGTREFSTLYVTGSITTAADFSISSSLTVNGSFSASAGTGIFTGTSSISGTANLYSATINGTSLQLSTDSTLGIASALTIIAGTLNVTSSTPNTVNFNGTGAQNINGITYNNLTLSNGNSKVALTGVTVKGTLTIASSTTFVPGAFTHSIYGDWANNGGFTAGASTIQFVGSGVSNIIGATSFNILTLNKSSANSTVTTQSNVSASTVNMTLGTLLTGSNTITITTTRTGNGKIQGNIQRTHTFIPAVAYAFESPNNTITFSSVLGVSSVTVSVIEGDVSDFPLGSSVNEQYAIAIPSGTYTATLRLDYDDDELNGNDETTMTLWTYNGSSWTNAGKSANDFTSNYVEQSGLTNITTRWTLSNPNGASVVQWNGSVSTDWNTAANWTVLQGAGSRPPSASDIVHLGTVAFTYNPTISSTVNVKNILFGSAQAVSLSFASSGSLTSANIDGNWSNSVTHTINVNNQSLTINGDLSLSDGVSGHVINLNIGNGTVHIDGSIIQAGGANVVFSGAGALNVDGDYQFVSGTFTAGAGTVTYGGSSNQSIAAVSYHNLTINKASAASINQSITVVGDLHVMAGVLDNFSTTTISGNVTIDSGATFHNTNGILHIGGNWTNNGSYAANGASIFFDGSGTQNISASTFNNLNINKPVGSTAVLTGNVVINGDLTVISGTLNIKSFTCDRSVPGGTITLADSATFIVGANNAPANFSAGTLANSSTVIADGTGPQAIYGESFGNLVFRNSGAKTLIAPITVNGDLTIESGSNFDAGSQTLTLNGNWINNGTFTSSDSTVLLGGSAKNISGVNTFNRVVVIGSYTVLSDITYNGLLHVSSTGSLSAGATTHSTLHGDLINSGVLYVLGTTTVAGDVVQNLNLINAVSTVALTVNFNGSVAPILHSTSAPQFGYLNINTTGGVSPSVGWTILYTMTIGTGASFNGGSSAHNLLGSVDNNGTITSSGTLNFSPSTSVTVNLGSNFSSTGNVTLGGTGVLTLGGTPSSFHDLVVSNTNAAGISPSSDWTITNILSVTSGATLNAGSHSVSVGGDLWNNGTINSASSTFTLNGNGAQELFGTSGFNNLTIDKAADTVRLDSDATVNGVLAFVHGKIETGSSRVIQTATGTVLGASQNTGWVIGKLQKNIAVGAISKTFEVGDSITYSPVSLAFSNVTIAGDLTVSTTSGDHPNINSSTINAAKSVNRYWSLSDNGILFSDYSVVFNFASADLDLGATTNAFVVGSYNGGSWTNQTVGTLASTSTQATGVKTFGDFQIGGTSSIPAVALSASVNPLGYVRPGTDLVYTISFTNNGVGKAIAFEITDPIPANTDFKIGSATTSLGTTGLIPTLSFSNDGGTTWTYTPASGAGGAAVGYDRYVTNVRWSFGSSLSQSAPDNTGSVSFTARIR